MSPTGLCKSWLRAWVWADYSLHLRRTQVPSLQKDEFNNFFASGSATSHVPALAQHLCSVLSGQSHAPCFVHCLLLLDPGDRPGVELLASLHSQPFLWFSFFVCFLFLSLLMPFLLSPSFQWSVSGLCPHHLYQSCIAYLVNSTKCCLWIYSLRWLVCA